MQISFAEDTPETQVKLLSINQMAGTWSCESTGSVSLNNGDRLDVKEHGTEKIDNTGMSQADLTLHSLIRTAKVMIIQDVSTHSDGMYRLQDDKLIDRIKHIELVSYKIEGLQDQTKVEQLKANFIAAMNHDVENQKEATYTVTRFTGDQFDFTDNEDGIVINGACKKTAP